MQEMVVIGGNVVGAMGETSGNKEDLTNVKRVVYRWQPESRYEPQTVMNTTNPIGFRRPHKYVVGEIHCLSEAYAAFHHNGSGDKDYILPTGENLEIAYVVFTMTDSAGNTWIYTFTGFVPLDEPMAVNDGEDVIQVYPFVAKSVAISGTGPAAA